MANNPWRPLKFQSKEELENKIEEYFKKTPLEEQMITGLAVHLDTSREVLCNYEKKDDFVDTIKRAKRRIEFAYEKRGLKVGNAFDIFRLKNMGWRDSTEQVLDHKGNLGIVYLPKKDGLDTTGKTEESSS